MNDGASSKSKRRMTTKKSTTIQEKAFINTYKKR
jgi:hypothetical protein